MLRGFFHPVRTELVNKSTTKTSKPRVKGEPKAKLPRVFDCSSCGLDKGCNSPRMPVSGNGKKGILVIAEAPGEEEDKKNTQLIGRAGTLLRDKLWNLGIDLDDDCWKINSVNCRPEGNRKPTARELQCCWPRVEQVILENKPKFIWLMGATALETFYQYRDIDQDKVSITSWTKLCIPDKKYGCWILPQYHPSALLQNKDENLEAYFDINLKWAVSCLHRDIPTFDDWESKVVIITEFDPLVKILKRVIVEKPEVFIYDYETNAVKSYYPNTKVLSASFFFDGLAYSFPFRYRDHWTEEQLEVIEDLWKQILEDPEISKGAHGLKFEHKWSRKFKAEVKNWKCCTMTNQHILDSRDKTTGLKIQAFLRWGAEGYERATKPFMSEDPKTHLNKLEEVDLHTLLLYGGLDSLFEAMLDVEHDLEFRRMKGLRNARDFFHEGIFTIMKMEDNGIPVDIEYYNKEVERLQKERQDLITKLKDSPEAKKFEEVKGKPLSLGGSGSGMTVDVKYLFLEIMGIKSDKRTEKGNVSVDDEVLSEVDNEFVKNFVKARKIKKVLEYIEQYRSQVVDGRLHPNFNLHLAKTYRSTSDNPNFQNVPKHDLEAMKSVRSGIIASPGYFLMEADYSNLEVRGNCMVSLDPALKRYLEDPTTNMHRDRAIDLFLLEGMQINWKDEPYKDWRQHAKGFNFGEFYGDYYGQLAKGLWQKVLKDKDLKQHLRKQGISSYGQFEEHVRQCEKRMWDDFGVLKEWRNQTNEAYKRKGYVESFFGFREVGYLRRNQLCNMPVQGSCFHLLLWSAGKVIDWLEENNMKTRVIGQIHDSIVFEVWPEEKEIVQKKVYEIMCYETAKEFPWINGVPLDTEFDVYDKSWGDLLKE
jgi:uracil-DNA glycosylase family 4